MSGTSCSLHQSCDLAGRVELHHMVNLADVDSKFHGTRTNHSPRQPVSKPVLCINPHLAGERTVMHINILAGRKCISNSLRNASGVGKYQG